MSEYFQEGKPRFNVAFVWKLFRDLVGKGAFHIQAIVVRDFEDQTAKECPVSADKDLDYTPFRVEDWVSGKLRALYAWSDKLADVHGDGYRSAYTLIYLFSATAVFFALLPWAANFRGRKVVFVIKALARASRVA